MKQIYLLNGTEINEPDNYRELQIDVTYDKDSLSEAVTVNQWDFGVSDQRNANDAVSLLLAYIEKGKTGGTGVFEGMPFKIKLDNEKGTTYQLFDGYIDLSNANISNGLITAPAVEQGKLDWLNDVADSFSFEFLYSNVKSGNPGHISSSDFIAVPYVINKKQNAIETIVSIVTIFIVVAELKRIINGIYWDLIHCQNPLEFTFIATLVLNIIYAVGVLISLVKLIVDLFNTLIQPVKYHYGMLASTLLQKAFEYLGLGFSSSILQKHPYDKLVIIPEKYQIYEQNTGVFENVTGYLKVNQNEKLGYYKGTFGQLLRELKGKFNARLIEDGGTYYFEKQNYRPSAPVYQLPDYEDNGYGFNAEDFYSNYVISYQTDLNDKNTIQEYTGTSVQIQQIPETITNKKMVLTRGLQQVNIGFALGRRKTELNLIEKMMDVFFADLVNITKVIVDLANNITSTVNSVIGVVNKTIKALKTVGIKLSFSIPQIPKLTIPKFINQVDGSRVNMLKMETDFLIIPKMVLIDPKANPRNNVLLDGNEVYLSAKYLWDNYHYFTSFVKQTDDIHNQYLTKVTPEIPFTFDDYSKVRRSNQLLTADGKKGRITSLKFNPDKQTAVINYEVNEIYTSNLKEVIIEPNGK